MSDASLYIGADCGESHHHLALHDAQGEQIRSLRVRNDEEKLRKALSALVGHHDPGEVHVVLETTYGFSTRLVELVRDLGYTIWQVNPKALKSFRDLEGQARKTDAIDASLLARMACLKMKGCRLALSPRPDEQRLRGLGRLHEQLTTQLTRTKLRLRSLLLELCPEVVQKSWEGPEYKSQTFLSILERWPGFEGLSRARSTTLESLLRKHGAGREKCEKYTGLLKALDRSLPASREVWTMGLSLVVAQLRMLLTQRDQIDQQIASSVAEHPIAVKLSQMPGVGVYTAAVVVGELLPRVRTFSEAEVATYCGLTPLARRSGKGGTDIFARGTNKHALRACYMSAIASLQRSALDRAYYDKQKRQHQGHPKPHVAATIALARQRHKVMYKLMKTEAEYDKEVLLKSHLARLTAAA
jgi:transposase